MGSSGFAQHYLTGLCQTLQGIDPEQIDRAIDAIRDARDRDKIIYSCGNGGSASIASQMVVDMVKGGSYEKQTPRIKMISLTDSIATITAYANDVAYEVAFVEQLKNWARSGDVLIAISGSGNSPNVLKAVEYANDSGLKTIGCTTAEGGQLKEMVQIPLLVPTRHMGHLEDCFFAMTHVLCYAFIE
ncbi:MAG: SIS domain-containing protein [Pirellulales bacterium]|nr:SIS domain-containing protein [Pirellulales bacterium]